MLGTVFAVLIVIILMPLACAKGSYCRRATIITQ